MISAGDFRNGLTLEIEGNVVQVIEFQHVKPGKGAAFVRTRLKNIKNGGIIEINGGEFKCQTPYWTLNSSDSKVGTIVIKGGKFYKFNPATMANKASIIIPEGYIVKDLGDGWFEVVKA